MSAQMISSAVRRLLCASAALTCLSISPYAAAEVVNGKGLSPITKDAGSTRSLAIVHAKRDAVRSMLIRVIGRDRISEVSPDQIDEMADQISSDMIKNQTADRIGSEFSVTIEVDFDRAQFAEQLSAFNIRSSSQVADNNRQLMAVYLDMSEEMASDFSQPAEVNFEFDSAKGSSYSDRSSMGASSKESSADSYRSASSSSSRAAAGRSNGYGSAAYSGGSSSASSVRSASASSSSSSFAAQNNIQASEHDNVRIRHRVVYQQPPKSIDGEMITQGLSGEMLSYGIQTSNVGQFLTMAFGNSIPTYKNLSTDARYSDFLSGLRANNTPFFMGGTLGITQEGRSSVDNRSTCSATLNAGAFATSDGRNLAGGILTADAIHDSPQGCRGQLAKKLAKLASDKFGPQIQNHWRDKARSMQGQNSREMANYTLVLRGSGLDMNMQQSLIEAIQATSGANLEAFVGASSNEMQVTVSYAGTMPLQFSLFGNLRSKPGFGNMQSKVDGRSITLCLTIC